MKNLYILFLLSLLISIQVRSQNDVEKVKEDEKEFYVSKAAMSKIIQNKFGQLALGEKDASVLSNYLAVNPQNGSVSVNGFLALSNKLYLTTNISTGINDNVSVLFRGFKLNNNTSLDIKAHLRIGKMTRLLFSYNDKVELIEKLHGVDMQAQYKKDNIDNVKTFNTTQIDVESFQLHVIEKKIEALEVKLKEEIGDTVYKKNVHEQTAIADQCRLLYNEILKLKHEHATVKMHLDSLRFNQALSPDVTKQKKSIEKEALEKKEKIEINAPWVGTQFFWITARINPIRKSFYRYIPANVFENQLIRDKSDFLQVGLEFNYYQWKKRVKSNTLYINAGISYMKNNNLDDLNTIEFKDETTTVSGNTTRKTNSSYKAYQGDYKEFKVVNTYLNIYRFFSGTNQTSIHLFPDVEFREENVNLYNLGIGLVLSLKDKKDEKTIINLEPFFRLTDMGDNLDTGLSFFKRSEIGFRLGLPINPFINQ